MKFLPLKKKKDFTRVLKTGKRYFSASVTVVVVSARESKFAVCVGKKFGKSVVRNRIKRLLREAFRFHSGNISEPCLILLIPKVAPSYSYETFKRDVGRIFKPSRTKNSAAGELPLSENLS